MLRGAILLLGLIACTSTAPPVGPFFHDDKYLRFGVDPDAEANAVIESQKEREYRLAHRLVGQHFTALGFMDRSGRSTAVRILTLRGIGVALDGRPQSALEEATRYALLAPPIRDTHDADRDGFDEVFTEERTPHESCVSVYRVHDTGFVDLVRVDAQVFGQRVCARSALDLDGDGVVELWTEIELGGFPIVGAAIPRLSLPLWAARHRFVARAGTPAQRTWLAHERAQREVALQLARKQLDVATCYVLAVELAALAYLERGEPGAQLAAFDRALNGLVLAPAQASATLKARARIYTDWNAPEEAPEPTAVADLSAKDAHAVDAQAASASKGGSTSVPSKGGSASVPSKGGSASSASKRGGPSELALQEALSRVAPASSNQHFDEPRLADGEFVITPQTDTGVAPPRRGARPRPVAGSTSRQPSAVEWDTYRAAARELASAAVSERERAAIAREAAATERNKAQAARQRVLETPEAAARAELRRKIAEHVQAAQRYAEEAAELSAASAMHRATLLEHKALLQRMLDAPATTGDAR